MRLDHLLSKETSANDVCCNVLVRLLVIEILSLFNLEGASPRGDGGLAQLEEHLLCKQGVSGSSPLISTMRANSSAG